MTINKKERLIHHYYPQASTLFINTLSFYAHLSTTLWISKALNRFFYLLVDYCAYLCAYLCSNPHK